MQKSSGLVLAPPPRSRKASARVALVDIKEPARSLLADCFKQFGIEAVVMTGNVPERLQREKLEACVVHLTPEAVPVMESARRSASNNRMVIYGGGIAVPGVETFFGDTWALDFNSDPPAWTELHPGGTLPPIRDNMPAAYDPLSDRMIVYGGYSGSVFLSDTQFLSWGGTSSEAQLTGSGNATPTTAHLEWDVDAATGTHAAVYRKPSGGEWTALAEAEVSGAGNVTFDDATVTAGQDYDYMMVVGSQRGETFGGTTSIEVSATLDVGTPAPEFALHRVVPNPVVREMAVTLSLPTSDPATLDLLDASGRRWLGREVDLGSGTHQVDLSPGRVPAGLYFLRLQQGGHVAMARVVFLGK